MQRSLVAGLYPKRSSGAALLISGVASITFRSITHKKAAQKAAPAMLRHALQRAAPRHALQRAAPAAAAARRTYLAQPKQRWHLIDAAQGVSVGRLAAAIAPVLRGKHKPGFEPHRHEHGDNVVVVNADRLVFTGRKWKQKVCLLYTSPSPRDGLLSRMPSSA